MKTITDIRPEVLAEFRRGTVIPAQPLALDENRKFAPKYQRALCRYYIDAGVGLQVAVSNLEKSEGNLHLREPVK